MSQANPKSMPAPAVSVIVPAYNAEATLERTAQAVMAQSFPSWELLIIDDGSSDGTARVIDRLVRSDNRIRSLSQPRVGVSAARNLGLTNAVGSWVLFLDADDWVATDFLGEMLAAARANEAAAVLYCGSLRVLPGGDLLAEMAGSEMTFPAEMAAAPLARLAHCCPLAIHSVLVRRETVVAAGCFDATLRSSEDWDLWVRVARTGARFVGVPKALAFYRMRTSDSHRDFRSVITDAQKVLTLARQADTRVARSDPRFVEGHDPADLPRVMAEVTLYFASVATGAGVAPRGLLEGLPAWPDYSLEAPLGEAITAVLAGVVVGAKLTHESLPGVWQQYLPGVRQLLQELARASSQPAVAARLLHALEERLRARLCPAQPTPSEPETKASGASGASGPTAVHVPVLMYHSIAVEGPPALAQWRLHPDRLVEQLQYLRDNDFYAVSSSELLAMLRGERMLHGRPVMLSFDDGYLDFHDTAWPIIRSFGFSAEVFLVTDRVGGHAEWDSRHGPPAALMDWPQIRQLQTQGVTFGSHLATHRRADELSVGEMIEESTRSRLALESKLDRRINSVAMPFGVWNQQLLQVLEQTGYDIGFTTVAGQVAPGMTSLALPRIEIVGDESPQSFARKLAAPTAATSAAAALM